MSEFDWTCLPGKTVLLGPNGAGKSTLLALAADALRPDSGSVVVDGLLARGHERRAYRAQVGWMPQTIRAVAGLTAREQVSYAGWLKGMASGTAWTEALHALDQVNLLAQRDQVSSSLSGGQLRRLGIAQVLVHQPKVMLLDEPSAGLDPGQRAQFREVLRSLPPDGTLVVSTHQVDDLSELFDCVAVINGGVICFTGSVREFLEQGRAAVGSVSAAEAAYMAVAGGEG